MLINPDLRRRAKDAQATLETLSQRAAEFGAACGMSALSYPPLVGLAAASGFVSVLAFGTSRVKKRTANDPARDDYASRTYLRGRRVNPERFLTSLRESDALNRSGKVAGSKP
jgi:hypothetical protein